MPSTRIRQRLRSMDSSVPGPEAGQAHRTPGATAVAQERGAAEGLSSAIAVVAQEREAVEGLKSATEAVAEAVKVA